MDNLWYIIMSYNNKIIKGKSMKNSIIYYSVGALLYCPANSENISNSIISEKFGNKFSLALCLEDTINDNYVKEAENILLCSLNNIYKAHKAKDFYVPKIFIRVRNPEQIPQLTKRMGDTLEILTGYIVPKFSLENADSYISAIESVVKEYKRSIYLMPIFENPDIVNLQNRYKILYGLKEKLDCVEDLVLNIRVGGNDLSHAFGLRRHANESIHNMKPVSNILTDIFTVFGMDYIVSGPVWEYYSGNGWDTGLKEEINKDLLCGFIGKTVIHPKQIPIVNNVLKVSVDDLNDAKSILNWDKNLSSLVSGNIAKERMNEYKTHSNWALKTIFMSEYYGVKQAGENF